MAYTAQDVLDVVKKIGFPYSFNLDDAQKVLDGSPERVRIGDCYFQWDNTNGTVTYNCPEELDLTYDHPDSPRVISKKQLDERLRKLIKKDKEEVKKKKKPNPFKPK